MNLCFNADILAKSVGCKNENGILFEEYFEIRKADDSNPNDPKFEYFKKKILDHLAELEKKENGYIAKSIDLTEWIQKANFPVGTIRTWNGQKFRKITPKKWVRVYESESRGAKLSVAALRRKAAACKNSEELYQLCLENMERFRNKEGHPLPFMQEFSEYVSGLNGRNEPPNDDYLEKNYPGYKGKGQEAVDFIAKNKGGQVMGAFNRPEIGDIDVVWGKVTNAEKHEGYGLAHIIDKRGIEAVKKIGDIIKDGQLVTDESNNRISIEYDGYHLGLRQQWNGKKKIWIVTNFKKGGTTENSYSNSDYTGETLPVTSNSNISQNGEKSNEKKNKEEPQIDYKKLEEYAKKIAAEDLGIDYKKIQAFESAEKQMEKETGNPYLGRTDRDNLKRKAGLTITGYKKWEHLASKMLNRIDGRNYKLDPRVAAYAVLLSDKARNADFSDFVDDFVKGGYKSDKIATVLNETPKILKGCGIPDNPITVTSTILKKILQDENNTYHGHNIAKTVLKDLPNQLKNPVYVLKGKYGNKVIVTEHYVENRPVIAVLEIDRKQGRINVNSIRTVYDKKNDIFSQWISDKNNIDYENKEKSRALLQSIGLQSTEEATTPDNPNIPQTSEKSNEKKRGALRVLTKQETHDFIEKHKTSKINERVSLGNVSDETKKRIQDATGIEVERVILDSDSVRHAYDKPAHNLEPNDLDDMKDVIDTTTDISLSSDKNPQGNPIIIFKKQEANGVILCEEYRAGKKELELQTAYRIKKNRQPHGAGNNQLPANVLDATAPNPNIQQTGEKSSGKKGIESISTKYHSSKSIDGDEDEIYVGKETISGKWKLVEADAPSASHDEITFRKTEGFPATKTGGTVNDRDYEHDTAAQEAVLDMSADFDGRALGFDSPIVVTQDGVVTSGNNRTMSSKLASRKGTDTKYIEALKKRAKKFGFSSDDVAQFKHPRVVFETVHSGDYTTDEFAKYNESGKKAKSPIEKAVEVSKRMKTEVVENIANNISDFDTMGELYANKKASQSIFNTLIQSNIIQKTDLPQYYSDNSVTAAGKELLETVLIGSVINETNIRQLNTEGGKSIRQKLVRAITPLIENKAMKGYSINKELNEAVSIAVEVARNKDKFPDVEAFGKQQDMFRKLDPVSIELAKKLEGTQKGFAEFMLEMNGGLRPAANGEVDIFFGGVESKEDIVNRVLHIKETVKKALDRFFRIFEATA